MKEPNEDDERLAALLEGRVQANQREDMLARLAAADDDYEVFAGTAGVLRALEEEDARGRPPRVPSMGRGGWRRTTIAVTGTVVLLLVLGVVWKGRAPSLTRTPQQLALAAYPSAQGLPPEWRVPTPSNGVRGARTSAERKARAVYNGALLVDLSIAIRTRDTARTRELAGRLHASVDRGVDGTALHRIAEHPGAPADSLSALLEQAMAGVKDPRGPLELGAWLEAARLAANQRNADFFADGGSEGMLRRAKGLARDERAAQAVRRVRDALPAGSAPRWDRLENDLATLLARLSG
ncbi:MAG TPA: hypothetical protein VFT45_23405 [Longimicrobium sp.]|nr:hypothetical protein [Longimicrobium sp.]